MQYIYLIKAFNWKHSLTYLIILIIQNEGNQYFNFKGLPNESLANSTYRKQTFGTNAFIPPVIKTLWELIAENFEDKIN